MLKKKICVSISSDVYKDIEEYSRERGISLSVSVERMLIKGLENTNNFKEENLINQLKNLLSNSNEKTEEVKEEIKEEVKENKIDKDKLNEDYKALFDIFNSMPD